jgi:hypothetical protein
MNIINTLIYGILGGLSMGIFHFIKSLKDIEDFNKKYNK